MRLLLIVIWGIIFAGCGEKPLSQQTFSGTLEITEHQLGPKTSGRVITLSVEEGAMVKAGDVIATLDRFEQAQKDYDRAGKVYAKGGVNLQTLEYAKLAMEDQRVVAPIDGIVLVKVHEVGESIASGAPVIVLGDLKDQWVKVYVPEGVVNQLQLNQKAVLSFDGLNKRYNGHIRYIATKAEFTPRNVQTPEERVTQAFAVKVVIDEPDLNAHPGVAVDVRFNI